MLKDKALRIAGLVIMVLWGSIQAATIYVSPGGNDSNNGSSPSSAVQTINRGVQLATSPADVVECAGGTYGVTHIQSSAKTAGWSSNLLIKAAEGAMATLASIKINAKRITLRSFKTNGGVAVEYGADYTRLEYIIATKMVYWENYADNVTWYYCQGNQPFSSAADLIRIGSSYHDYRPLNMVVEGCCFQGSSITGSDGNHIDLCQVLGARSITFKNSVFYKAPTGIFMIGPGPIEGITWDGCYIGGGKFYPSAYPNCKVNNCIIDGSIMGGDKVAWTNNKISRWSPGTPWPAVFQGNVIKCIGWSSTKCTDAQPPAGNTKDPNLVITKPACPSGGGVISSLNFYGDPLTGAPPLTVTFNNTSSSDYTSFEWSFGDGAASTDKSPSHTYTAYGSYTVTLKGTSKDGQKSIVQTNYITVQDAPTVIEAEKMSLSNYIVDTGKMGGAGIMIDPNLPIPTTGTATATFSGGSGTFDITVATVPENDGQPVIKLYINSNKVWEQQLPMESAFYNPLYDRQDYTIEGIALTAGDVIKLEGNSHYATDPAAAAFGRLDKITLQPVAGSASILNWSMPQLPGSEYVQTYLVNLRGQRVDKKDVSGVYLRVPVNGGYAPAKVLITK